jgi:hypothetical protein
MITLTRKQAQELLDLLEYFNQFSLPPRGIAIPAEIDDLMDLLRVRLAEPWTPDDTAYRPGGLPQPDPSPEQDIAVYGMAITKDGKRIDPASIYKEPEPAPWRGLTSTERKVLWLTSNNPAEFGEFIEAKLREKNERRA